MTETSATTAGAKSTLHTTLELWLKRLLGTTAALAMFAMMAVTFVDVIGRDFFLKPLPGGFEITELLLASINFLGLPLVTAEGGHVDVDLMDSLIPKWLKPIQNIFIGLLNLVAMGTLSWLMWEFSARTWRYEDSSAILQIPYGWLTLLMAITCTLTTLILLLMLLTRQQQLFEKDEEYPT